MVAPPANALGTRAGRHELSSRSRRRSTTRCPWPAGTQSSHGRVDPSAIARLRTDTVSPAMRRPAAVGVVDRWIHWWRASGTHDDVGAGSSTHGPVFSPSAASNCASAAQRLAFQPDALEAERRVGVCEVLGPIRWRLIQSRRRTRSPAHVRRESPATPPPRWTGSPAAARRCSAASMDSGYSDRKAAPSPSARNRGQDPVSASVAAGAVMSSTSVPSVNFA